MYKLRITADDFGATKSINKAVEVLHQKGILNYAALMVQGKEVNNALDIIKRNKNLKVGLHFTITDEISLSNSKSISDKRRNLYSRKNLLLRIFLKRINKIEIHNELSKQVDFFEENNINLNFINGHQHSHTLPLVRDIIINFAKQKNIYLRSISQDYRIERSLKTNLYNLLKFFFYRSFNKRIKKYNISTNKLLISPFNKSSKDFSINSYKDLFNSLKFQNIDKNNVVELMIHPAADEEGLSHYWYKNKSDIIDRIIEFQTLESNEFNDLCKSYNFEII